MAMVARCSAITKDGKQCTVRPLPDSQWCHHHDPALAERRDEMRRKGGEARSNARRAVRQWTAAGRELETADIPHLLRSCMFSVKAGTMEPSVASAIVALAKASVSIDQDVQLEARIAALEEAVAMPGNVRRIG
jgi:hypothetical protein